jgi:hypothetical protein
MMPMTLQQERPAYNLTEGLRESARSFTLYNSEPEGWSRHELLLRKLGPKSWERVLLFRNYFASGWGEDPRVLSPRAFDAFFRFVEGLTFPAGNRQPSVFLTDRGGIELCWEDEGGTTVQVEFTGKGMEYYKGATDEEGFVPFDGLTRLAQRLSA